MPNLVDNWTVDRSPGQGKTLLVSGSRVGIGGLTGIGQPSGGGSSTPPSGYAPLMPAGMTLPPPGSSEREQFFLAFKAASGFDGNTYLSGVPSTTDSTKWSLSTWLNLSVKSVVGFNPSPLANVQSFIGAGSDEVDSNYFGNGTAYVKFGNGNGGNGPAPQGTGFDTFGPDTFIYPLDYIGGEGWFHLMVSIQVGGGFKNGVGFASQSTIIYINDIPVVNQSGTVAAGLNVLYKFKFSGTSGGVGGVGVGGNLFGAATEWWEAPGQFINWNDRATRYMFHTSDDAWGPSRVTYAPVNIGSNGAKPTGTKPRLYLSGAPPLFPLNRAGGATLTVNGDALVLIDDLPG